MYVCMYISSYAPGRGPSLPLRSIDHTLSHTHTRTQTPDPGKAAALAAALEDPGSDSYADMELFVGDALASEAGVLVQALDASLGQRLTVPAYKSPDFTKAFANEVEAAAGSNSVRLVDAAHAGVPLARAVTGQQYAVKLGGFPPNAKLTVQLLGQKVRKEGRKDGRGWSDERDSFN